MGNKISARGRFADIELEAQKRPVVAIDERFLSHADGTRLLMDNATSPYSKDFVLKDGKSKKPVFRAGPDAELRTLLDTSKKPIVTVAKKRNVDSIYYVYLPEADPYRDDAGYVDPSDDSELFQIYFKMGWKTRTESRDTTLRADFSDRATGERCRTEFEGEWYSHCAMLWLVRASSNARSPLARVFKPAGRPASEYYVDIVPNVDTALVLTICAVLDEQLKREERHNSRTVVGAMMNSKSTLFFAPSEA
ncbi:hypothetical protein PybrP1_000890 [[Pythium] brassicae (nom. inval.)]|nr:hypothetical protein PybrP1_000890 [[Pythium] brassicae (nom. inval.)]